MRLQAVCLLYTSIRFTEDVVLREGPNAKMSPPLRTQEDLDEIIMGIKDGTIDAIATDHAPHTAVSYTHLDVYKRQE